MKNLLSIFRNRLLDLSSSNRSVFLPKVYKGKFSDLKTWDYLAALSSFDIVKAMISGKALIKIADVKYIQGDQLEELLEDTRKLMRTRQLILDETGSADFYIGWPFVEGVLKNGMSLRAPLIFFPYQLKQVGRELFLEKGATDEPFWNRSLFLSLSYFEEYQFDPAWLENPVEGVEDRPEQDFRVALLDVLKQQGWSPSFDRDFLSENLIHCLPTTKGELTEKYAAGEYKLKGYGVMGLFPQSASYIHSDYDRLKEIMGDRNLEEILDAQYKEASEGENGKSASIEFTPLAVDGSQENIISKVSSGQSLVVQGPPGSGKTQLICNLIAQFLGKGKKVLVVCQKKAALDVIYERLQSIELDRFVSLLHDAIIDKKGLYEKINNQIQSSEEYKKQNIHPDTIVLEKEFSRIQSAIARLTEFFAKYKQALYDTHSGGASVHDLYLKSNKQYSIVNLELEFQEIPVNDIENKSIDLEQFLFYHAAIAQDFELIHAAVNQNLSIDNKEEMLRLLEDIPNTLHQLQAWNEQENLLTAIDFSYAQTWLKQLEEWKHNALLYRYDVLSATMDGLTKERLHYWKQEVAAHFVFLNQLLVHPTLQQATVWQQKIEQALQGAGSRLWFQLTLPFAEKDFKQWLRGNKLHTSKDGLLFLTQVFSATHALHELQEEWKRYSFLPVSSGLSEQSFTQGFETIERLHKELEQASGIPALKALWYKSSSFKNRLDGLLDLVQNRNKRLAPYFVYWKAKTVDRLFAEETYRKQWLTFIHQRFERWLGYEQLKQNLPLSLFTSFHKVIREVLPEHKEKVIETWKQSLWRHWIDEKERIAPILKSVSTPEWEMKEQELQVLIDRRYSISLEFLKIKLREWVYAGITYNRLNRQVTYRDLSHQVNKKRSIWPVRKLIAQHEEEVLDLIPCWLVSPETASTVFPMHDLFDLVIFDEASQCFVEKAFPSLFRAKQAVVIGDDKQLKPTDLYRVRYKSEDEEEEIDYEVESLLDFSSRYFPSDLLSGHYRSKSEALIRFSNEHFYNNRLRVVPDIAYADKKALEYIKVDGLWTNNTNPTEAEEVVYLIRKLLVSDPGKSIGVITFNYPQAFLIRDELEHSGIALPADLFVKNIENVQGDERDIIIFSVAYAKNAQGKIVTQFGSLSQEGGENRLNVAVSRARERVLVVASILPEELHVEHHKNKGATLLKSYMQYVHQADNRSSGKEDAQTDLPLTTKESGLKEILLQTFSNQYSASYFSDVRAKANAHHLVFTDDKRYFFSPSVNDWHAYSQRLFTQKGWKVNYAYSRNYWFDKERLFDQLKG